MFDEVFGLPAHPLIVHGAVVLGPLLCLAALGYALLPRFRAQLGWLAVALAVAAPLATFAAVQSGAELLERSPAQARGRMATHQDLGQTALWFVIPLGLVVLEDDRGYFPPYDAVPVLHAGRAAREPDLASAVDALAGRIDAATMRRMNHAVDGERRAPAAVAREFLREAGLIR